MSLKQCFKGSLDVPLIPYGRRVIKTIAMTAGNVITNLNPGVGKRWNVMFGEITLITDGTAANRYVRALFSDAAGNTLYRILNTGVAITANTTISVEFGKQHILRGSDGVTHNTSLPNDAIIEGTDLFKIYIANGQAGDSYSGRFVVMEYDV